MKNQDYEKIKDIVETEIYNFIDFYTSDDTERENMKKVVDDYMKEEYSVNENEN
jgi:hypothetical protein